MKTEEFFKMNPDIICMIADKGNITLRIKKSEYIRDMEALLSNEKIRKKTFVFKFLMNGEKFFWKKI